MNRALHYEKVAREFEGAGRQRVQSPPYLTDDIVNRVDQARAQLLALKRVILPRGSTRH